MLAFVGAFGGIVDAFTLRFAGATEKTLSTSLSIVITGIVESILRENVTSSQGAAASMTVVLGVVLYALH